MKTRLQPTQILVIVLLVATLVLGALSQKHEQAEIPWPHAQFSDSTPLGGKGLRLLFEWLGYPVRRVNQPLKQMPADARVWVLLDYKTTFSRKELRQLQDWVKNGGTLLFAMPAGWDIANERGEKVYHPGHELAVQLGLDGSGQMDWAWEPLPPLAPLTPGAPTNYWSDVKKASASTSTFNLEKGRALEIAGNVKGTQMARLDLGKGRIFVAADALLFTNYALDSPDNAIFVTNLVRAHVQPSPNSAIYFDERQHGENVKGDGSDEKRSWAYYLWRPPLRFAVLQVLFASLLTWMLFGRRLGAPVPLPDNDPVTRASHFAQAMGALLQKGKRPRVAAEILGDEFRRNLAGRLGMSAHDSDEMLANRAAQIANLPAEHVLRLLRVAKAPMENEDTLLNEVQQMENVMRKISR